MSHAIEVLIAVGSEHLQRLWENCIEKAGYEVTTVGTLLGASLEIERGRYLVVIASYDLPDGNATQLRSEKGDFLLAIVDNSEVYTHQCGRVSEMLENLVKIPSLLSKQLSHCLTHRASSLATERSGTDQSR